MKLAIGFLILGAALAVPQNFFLTFHPKSNFASPGESADHGAFRGPMSYEPNSNRNNFAFLPKTPYGFPFAYPFHLNNGLQGGNYYYNPEGEEKTPVAHSADDAIEGRRGLQQRFFFGGGFGGFPFNPFNPFVPSVSRKFITLLDFTTTTTSTMTMSVVSSCIPLASFSDPATTDPCNPTARRKRSLWADIEESESAIDSSEISRVVPTTLEELPTADRPNLKIQSSQDEQVDDAISGRQKRFFLRITPTITLTTILSTASTSTTFTQVTTTATLTQYSSYICLPPGTLVCS